MRDETVSRSLRSRGQIALLLAIALSTSAPPSPSPALAQQDEQTFRGFGAGEEVRYAYEREGEQPGDPVVHWTITLRQIHEGGSEATFELSYLVAVAGRQRAQAIADVRVNEHGFPLRVLFGSERVTALGGLGYTIEYRWQGGEYRKELVESGLDDQEIELDDYPGVDTRARRGLYLYNPLDAACAEAFTEVAPVASPPAGEDPGEPVIEELCGGRELIFANPGLLSLVMPSLWEAGTGSLDFWVLAPTGMRLDLFTAGPAGPPGGVSVGGINLLGLLSGGPDPFHDGERALQRFSLRSASDLLQLELGGRTVDAWQLATPAPFAPVYVDGSGSIVRLDVPGRAPDESAGWIRRLRPSEF